MRSTGLNGMKALEQRSTSDRISDEPRQMIIEGALRPGEQLGEAKIAEQLGVSRAPVREALHRLVQERLLVAERNKGVTVVSFSASDVWEIYDARAAIERHAASRLLESGQVTKARAVDALRAVLAELATAVRTGDSRRVSAADHQFHTRLVAAADNSRLLQSYVILSGEALACINRLEIALPSGADLVEDHEHLLRLLAQGEREPLLDAISSHLTVAATHLTAPPTSP